MRYKEAHEVRRKGEFLDCRIPKCSSNVRKHQHEERWDEKMEQQVDDQQLIIVQLKGDRVRNGLRSPSN